MSIWFKTIHQWTNSSNRKLFFVYWFNLCFPPKPCYEVSCHSSLHPNCHHQLVFAKFDLKIFYPPPYKREIWHYNNVCTDIICRSAHEFSWENSFSNTDANQKVCLFNEPKRIVSNFKPHETIVCDNRDPPWINSKFKNLIVEKNIA